MADVIRKRLVDGVVSVIKLADGTRKHLAVYERFDMQPGLSAVGGYGNPAGTTGEQNQVRFRSGLAAQYIVLGAGQTILGPAFDFSTGLLDISQDATVNEGVEYVFGGNHPRNPYLITVNTSASRSLKGSIKYEDVSGVARAVFGWRKQEAAQADYNDYADFIVVNMVGGVITIESAVGGAATVVVANSTVVADLGTLQVELKVESNGKVYIFINGAPVAYGVPYTFTAALALVPFYQFLHATDLSLVWPTELEIADLDELNSLG